MAMEALDGQVAFITGGAQGIGLAIARAFAAAGVRLVLADIDDAAREQARDELARITSVETYHLDVRDRETFARVADDAERRLGPVTLLCNNAGVGGEPEVTAMSYPYWDLILGVNLGGVVNGIQVFLPRMLDRGGPAHIVNTASAAGLAVTNGERYMYHAAKYGVVGLSEALRRQLEPHEIGVSVVCPGLVATNFFETSKAASPAGREAAELRTNRMEGDVLQRLGLDPDAVGEMVLEGVRADRLFIHTDRMMADLVQARARDIVAAMPAETERDRALADVAAKARAARG